MEQNQTKYTVFCSDGNPGLFLIGHGSADAVAERAQELWTPIDGWFPFAWCLGWPSEFGGEVDADSLRAESIAAGRLIEKVDGKYVARGIHSPMIAAAPEEKLASVKVCEEQEYGGWAADAGGRVEVPFTINAPEFVRAPLDWNKPTTVDRFPGFCVTSGTSSTTHSHSHPLQKMADGKEGFGSAALLKG